MSEIYYWSSQNGFEDFLRPGPLILIKSAASRYPVVILLASHCLIMASTSIHHIPLPKLEIPILQALVHKPLRLSISCRYHGWSTLIIEHLGEERGTRDPSSRVTLNLRMIYSKTCIEIGVGWISKACHQSQFKKWLLTRSSEILWLPYERLLIGHFTFLPIHAAGCQWLWRRGKLSIAPQIYFISS